MDFGLILPSYRAGASKETIDAATDAAARLGWHSVFTTDHLLVEPSKRWADLIDLDAGPIADGTKTIEQVGWELFQLMLDVASGRKQVWADKWGLHNDLVLFNPAPVT